MPRPYLISESSIKAAPDDVSAKGCGTSGESRSRPRPDSDGGKPDDCLEVAVSEVVDRQKHACPLCRLPREGEVQAVISGKAGRIFLERCGRVEAVSREQGLQMGFDAIDRRPGPSLQILRAIAGGCANDSIAACQRRGRCVYVGGVSVECERRVKDALYLELAAGAGRVGEVLDAEGFGIEIDQARYVDIEVRHTGSESIGPQGLLKADVEAVAAFGAQVAITDDRPGEGEEAR